MSIIELVPYQAGWVQDFLSEKHLLQQALPDLPLRIEHIGSTAIPGIYAKPVIDILMGVAELPKVMPQHIQAIEALGYRYQPLFEKEFPHRCYFQKNNSLGKRTHQIHWVNDPSSWWQKHILFRDYLRQHPEDAQQYETHKLELAQLHIDTLSYAIAKTDFCRSIDKKAYCDWSIHLPLYETERLRGYLPQPVCLEWYRAMFQNPDFVRVFGVQFDDQKLQTVLARDVESWDQRGFGPVLWFDKATQYFVGRGGLSYTTATGQPEIELTYALNPECWGQGYASEIGAYAIQEAFQTHRLDHLVCFTLKTNQPSLRVMQKLGFEYKRDFTHAELPHVLYHLLCQPTQILVN